MSLFGVVRKRFSSNSLLVSALLMFAVGCTGYTAPAPAGNMTIATSSIPNGEYNVAYLATLAVSGGTAPYAWTVSSGPLPAGLTLSSAGVLSGTPTAGGTFTFSLQVTDSGQYQQVATIQCIIEIASQLVITTASLPSITANQNYSTQLTATGGSGANTWTLVSRSTLPAGLTLSSGGIISGKPTSAGTATFTVQASDAGSPPQTATKSLTIVVLPVPALSITTSALPSSPVGSAYSATLLSQGGTLPITWGLASGSTLPGGLFLNSATGVISGTPAASGSFSFTVKASDASTPQQTATQTLALNVTAVAPLTITTESLSSGTAGASYSATVSATGGIAPLTWSVPVGSLPPGLSLNSATGLISGTPSSSGITTFTLQVADAETPAVTATKQYALTINATLGSGVNNAELTGSYAFLFNGFSNGSAPGSVHGVAILGTITADGNGNLNGVEDVNTSAGFQAQVPVTGQYAIGSDNRGMMILNNGVELRTYAVSTASINSGVAQKIKFVEFDDASAANSSGVVGTGVAKLQNASAFTASTLKGSFVFGLQGETPCSTCASPAVPFGPVVAAGIVVGDGSGNLNGQQDAGAMSTSYSGTTLSGSYTNPASATGHGTITLSATGTIYPAAPADFVYYVVSSSEWLMMSSDSHAAWTLLSGDVQLQQQSSFTAASPTGVMIAYESNASGGDGVAQYPGAANASLAMLSITSSGTANLTQDVNKAGVFATPAASAVTYTVGTNGRMPVSIGGGGGPVFYLYNNTQAFGLDIPQPGTAPGLILLEEQTPGSTPPRLSGKYSVATLPGAAPAIMTGGSATLAANTGGLDGSSISGHGTLTLDSSSPAGNLVSAASSLILYQEDATGRATTALSPTSATASVIYVISPTKAVQISTGSDNAPMVLVLEK